MTMWDRVVRPDWVCGTEINLEDSGVFRKRSHPART